LPKTTTRHRNGSDEQLNAADINHQPSSIVSVSFVLAAVALPAIRDPFHRHDP
jgi:hypothetical protein